MVGDPKWVPMFNFGLQQSSPLARSQIESFEADLEVTGLRESERPFTGIFIRAPVRHSPACWLYCILTPGQVVLTLEPSPEDPPIQVVSCLSPHLLPESLTSSNSTNEPKTFVALRQGRHFLTTFHPELTRDNRFHEYFVKECVLPSIPWDPHEPRTAWWFVYYIICQLLGERARIPDP